MFVNYAARGEVRPDTPASRRYYRGLAENPKQTKARQCITDAFTNDRERLSVERTKEERASIRALLVYILPQDHRCQTCGKLFDYSGKCWGDRMTIGHVFPNLPIGAYSDDGEFNALWECGDCNTDQGRLSPARMRIVAAKTEAAVAHVSRLLLQAANDAGPEL